MNGSLIERSTWLSAARWITPSLEVVVGLPLDIFEIGKIAGIGERIEIDNAVVGVFVHKESYDVRADKSGTSGDKDITLHNATILPIAVNIVHTRFSS